MRIIILCGGLGKRLNDYSLPKPMNYIYGKPAFYYSLLPLFQISNDKFSTVDFIIGTHLVPYQFESLVRSTMKCINNESMTKNYTEFVKEKEKEKKCNFHYLPYFTRGAIESAYVGLNLPSVEIADNEPIVFLDNDILFNKSIEKIFDYAGMNFLGYAIDETATEAFCFLSFKPNSETETNKGNTLSQTDLENSEKIVEKISEKKRISNNFVCGIYGFKSFSHFKYTAEKILFKPTPTESLPKKNQELFMSLLFSEMVDSDSARIQVGDSDSARIQVGDSDSARIQVGDSEPIYGVHMGDVQHIGSLTEVKHAVSQNSESFSYDLDLDLASLQSVKPNPNHKENKLRICVDLDHTLVTTPLIVNDYSTVEPIQNMIFFIQQLKKSGHTIIIHTARKMLSSKHNVGLATANSAQQVFQTLEKFHIPYDEIIFGKPMADLYIDDKAFNPYFMQPQQFGFLLNNESTELESMEFDSLSRKPLNCLHPNKFNNIILSENKVVKRGPNLQGEIFYHTQIPRNEPIGKFFPHYFVQHQADVDSNCKKVGCQELHTEYIQGIPFAYLWKSKLLTTFHIDTLLHNLDTLHHTINTKNIDKAKISLEDIKNNYMLKTKERFEQKEHYNFPHIHNTANVQAICLKRLADYCKKFKGDCEESVIVDFIHGDLWFSNIIWTFENELKWFDMKGICWKTYTTSGDKMYDYAKLYQSFLGYDLVLNGWNVPNSSTPLIPSTGTNYYENIRLYYENKLLEKNVDLTDLKAVTFALILGTLPFIDENETKKRVWDWAVKYFVSELF